MNMIGIYKITNPNGRIYIGQSIDIEKRFYRYKTLQCKNQPKLYNSLKKYGWDFHLVEIIEECEENNLLQRETYWKNYYNVLNADSLCCKLDGKSGKCGKEMTEKMSQKMKKYWSSLSEEELVKRLEKIKLKLSDPEVRKINSSKLKGKPKSSDHKKNLKISQNREETVAKRKQSLKNYWENISIEKYEVERLRRIEVLSRPLVKKKLSENNPSRRPEVKEKQKQAALKRKKIMCPHCHKLLDPGNAKKYHLDRCKSKLN